MTFEKAFNEFLHKSMMLCGSKYALTQITVSKDLYERIESELMTHNKYSSWSISKDAGITLVGVQINKERSNDN